MNMDMDTNIEWMGELVACELPVLQTTNYKPQPPYPMSVLYRGRRYPSVFVAVTPGRSL
jgi:hypothetical protein